MELTDRFTGAMVGMAAGDALGMATEFLSEEQIPRFFGCRVTDYETNPAVHCFDAGEYTDDTSMALCIAESLLGCEETDIEDIAARFIDWKNNDGRDVGGLTGRALEFIDCWGLDPKDSGRAAWEESGKKLAGNGGIMRTAPVSLFYYNNVSAMLQASADICRITHYDPRCVVSCQAHNVLLWALLHGSSPVEAYELLCDTLGDYASDAEFEEVITEGRNESIGSMVLDTPEMGYTYLALKVAISALMNYSDFETPIAEIVNKAGDADTNACIAGSLLGALYGLSGIPKRWQDGLLGFSGMYELGIRFCERVCNE